MNLLESGKQIEVKCFNHWGIQKSRILDIKELKDPESDLKAIRIMKYLKCWVLVEKANNNILFIPPMTELEHKELALKILKGIEIDLPVNKVNV